MKYIIIRCTDEVDLKKGTARIVALCEVDDGRLYWCYTGGKGLRYVAFSDRLSAEEFIAEHKLPGAIPYSLIRRA